MAYDVEVSFGDLIAGEPLYDSEIAISNIPWVVTAGGGLGEKLSAMTVGATGSIDETKNGRTVKHAVEVASVERLGDGIVRVTYRPMSPALNDAR